MVESCVTQEEIKKEPEKPIDREKTCPLLLRVFTTTTAATTACTSSPLETCRPASCRYTLGWMQP